MRLSNLPPGVSGNEPHLTGEDPCGHCGGMGVDFHGHETTATVFHPDGTHKTFDNYNDAEEYARSRSIPLVGIIVDEWPSGEACCVPCKGTGHTPEPDDHVVYLAHDVS